jgi:hypothetical protein
MTLTKEWRREPPLECERLWMNVPESRRKRLIE